MNAEHSWADAPIVSYLVEYALGYEFLNLKYNMDGTVAGERRMDPIYPQRLKWRMPQEVSSVLFLKLRSYQKR